MKSPFRLPLRNVAVCSLLAALATSAQALDGTWTQITSGTASGNWVDSGTSSWAGNVVAGGSGFTADFSTLEVSGTSTITLTAPRTIGNLIFGDTVTTSVSTWNLAGTGANTLTLAGTTPTITVNSLGNASASAGLVNISASISGNNGLTKDGNGTVATSTTFGRGVLVLSGSNNYSGGTTINSGALRAQNSFALGTGAVTVANGAQLQLNGAINVANTININGASALFSSSGAGTPNLSGLVNLQSNSGISLASNNGNAALTLSGTVNLNGNILTANTINIDPAITLSAVIMGSGGIVKNGAGTLVMSGENSLTYTGSTTHISGVLALGSDGALGSGVFAFSPANDNAATLRSTSTAARNIGAAVSINGGNSNSRYLFGSTNPTLNGNLTFTNTTAIALTAGTKRFEVANRTQFDAAFTGAGGITMQGSGSTGVGTLVLNGSNSYTGATTVNAGTLLVNGSLSGSSAVTVATGATLGGSGTIGGTTTISGVLAPGSSTESLAFGANLTLQNTTNTIIEINGTNRGAGVNGYDAVDMTNVSGVLTYDGTLTLT
ncbi:MAG TPA: autotransporter-associated beta strand repeat-containing protein, partial [Chthoniobacteraceae bacterium]|nr:autotransporter-associated beta strand repeat-containing protein [Chthoniobacteraceae bacterium]